jgi:hypothetical protein
MPAEAIFAAPAEPDILAAVLEAAPAAMASAVVPSPFVVTFVPAVTAAIPMMMSHLIFSPLLTNDISF